MKKRRGTVGSKQDSSDTLYKKKNKKKASGKEKTKQNKTKTERYTSRRHKPTQGGIEQPTKISTAAVIEHPKSVRAGIAILLCQLLSVF